MCFSFFDIFFLISKRRIDLKTIFKIKLNKMELIITSIFLLLSLIYVIIKYLCKRLCKRTIPKQSNKIIKPTTKKLTDSQIERNKEEIERKQKQKYLEENNLHKQLHRIHIEIEGNRFTITHIDTENNESILLPENKHIKLNANILIKDDCIEYGLDDESDEHLISDILLDILTNPSTIQEYIIHCGEIEYQVIGETLLALIFEHFTHLLLKKGIKQHEIEITTNIENKIVKDRLTMAFVGMIAQTQQLYEKMEMKYEEEIIEKQIMILRELYFRINNNHLDKLLKKKYEEMSQSKKDVIKRFNENKDNANKEERVRDFEMKTKVELLKMDEKKVILLPKEYSPFNEGYILSFLFDKELRMDYFE